MKQYNVKEKRNFYDWRNHEKSEEISGKVMELIDTKVDLENVKFLKAEHFVQITEGLWLNEMGFLAKFLKED